MSLNKYHIRWSIIFVVAVVVALLFIWETNHLKIETDILESMPQNDPVLSDARRIIRHLPIQDKLFIDLEQQSSDRDQLVAAASLVAQRLSKSGLFTKVGISDEANNFPELMTYVAENWPLLFSAADLEQKVKPLLVPDKIKEAFYFNKQTLQQLEGIGRGEMIARDPLGFSGIILQQLSALLPSNKAQFHQGQLLSADGRHALIIAKIAGSGSDTAKAALIAKRLKDIEQELDTDKSLAGNDYILTSAGVYRAALDNETIAKFDSKLAVILTTIGIALLLIFAFPRPLIGLLALLPSTVGAIAALSVPFYLNPCPCWRWVLAVLLWGLPLIWALPIFCFWINPMKHTVKR
jgi:predicted exporter